MNGDLYNHFSQKYDELFKNSDQPPHRDGWMLVQWLAWVMSDPDRRERTYQELLQELADTGEQDLLDSLYRAIDYLDPILLTKRNS